MRILHVNCEFPPIIGGGAVEAALLTKELAKRHEVFVLTAQTKRSPAQEVVDGVHIFRCPVLFPWAGPGHVSTFTLLSFIQSAVVTAQKLRRQIGHIDVVNSWFAIPTGLASYRIAKMFDASSLLTLCGGDVYDPTKKMAPNHNPLSRRAAKFAIENHDYLTAISDDLAERARRTFEVEKNISVIPMGVDLSVFSPAEHDENPTPFRWFTACRLVERKGLSAVLRAFARLDNKNFLWHIVGEGPERANLERLVREYSLEDRVVLEGSVDEIRKKEIASLCHGFVLASFHEGQGQAILEAAAMGLPIVAGHVGGQTTMIQHDETGLLVTAGAPPNIAAALKSVMEKPLLRKKLRKNVLEIVPQYSIARTASRYESYFEEMLGDARSKGRRAAMKIKLPSEPPANISSKKRSR